MQDKPSVMVSSIVKGFETVRETARKAILQAGGLPILVNEDFPAQAQSSRNVCLDAVAASDVLVVIIGDRAGWQTPSGKYVVEEEYEEAKRLHKPILAFFAETADREEDAVALVSKMSDYLSGQFRSTYTDLDDLQSKLVAALDRQFQRQTLRPMQNSIVQKHVDKPTGVEMEPALRIVLAPTRDQELISPVDLESTGLHNAILRMGHEDGIDLLSYERSKFIEIDDDHVVIKSEVNGRVAQSISIAESGLIVLDSDIMYAGRPKPNGDSFGLEAVALEDIEARLAQSLLFCGALYKSFDPYEVRQTFHFNAVLIGLGFQNIERNPQPRSSMTMNMNRDKQIPAYEAPREIGRHDLLNPAKEVERACVQIVRRSKR